MSLEVTITIWVAQVAFSIGCLPPPKSHVSPVDGYILEVDILTGAHPETIYAILVVNSHGENCIPRTLILTQLTLTGHAGCLHEVVPASWRSQGDRSSYLEIGISRNVMPYG